MTKQCKTCKGTGVVRIWKFGLSHRGTGYDPAISDGKKGYKNGSLREFGCPRCNPKDKFEVLKEGELVKKKKKK